MKAGASPLEDVVALLLAHAKGLRDAGVRHLEFESFKVDLAPADVVVAPPARSDLDEAALREEMDPLLDAATYGRGDGRVPGFKRPDVEDDD